jgi:hypothetical protein
MAASDKPRWVSRPPRVGNIITCLYPGDPKGELRPVLVLETRAGSSGGFSVRVAYGTKNLAYESRGKIDLIIDTSLDIESCGVAVATRFDLEETAVIPWEPPLCDCWRGYATPILGELPVSQQVECSYKLAAIQDKQKK